MASRGRGHFPISYVGFRGPFGHLGSQPLGFVKNVPTGDQYAPLTDFFFDEAPSADVPLTEDSPYIYVAQVEAVRLVQVAQEEFAPAAAAALDDSVVSYPRVEAAQQPPPSVASEEFVAPTLTHEEPAPYLLHVDAAHFIYTVASQDFTTVAVVDDSPPSVIASWPSTFALTQPSPEDFAGSMPFDESVIFTTADWPQTHTTPTAADELPLPRLIEDEAPIVFIQHDPHWISVFVSDEEFHSPHLVDDPSPFLFLPEQPQARSTQFFDEDFAGSLVVDEYGPNAVVWRDRSVSVYPIDEPFPSPIVPPPPPPRPPPRPRALQPATSGGGNDLLHTPRRWIKPDEPAVDYAIVPLVGEVVVRALADGVVEMVVVGGQSVLRLTAVDGTQYFYANVRGGRTGRVKKDDAIGVTKAPSAALAAAPKLLDDGKTIEAQGEVVEDVATPATSAPPKPAYGVLPIPRIFVRPTTSWQPPVVYRTPIALAAPPPAPLTTVAIERRLSTGQIVLITVGVIGVSAAVAWFFWPRKKPKLKRRRRSRR